MNEWMSKKKWEPKSAFDYVWHTSMYDIAWMKMRKCTEIPDKSSCGRFWTFSNRRMWIKSMGWIMISKPFRHHGICGNWFLFVFVSFHIFECSNLSSAGDKAEISARCYDDCLPCGSRYAMRWRTCVRVCKVPKFISHFNLLNKYIVYN